MRVAILQSNYLPWKGYFDIIGLVDTIVFHDDLQFTKGDWRNRNRIKTPRGLEWITVPCGENSRRLIYQVKLQEFEWQRKHWKKIKINYSKAPHFSTYRDFFEDTYLNRTWENLSDLNQYLIKTISKDFLGIKTLFDDSRSYELRAKKGARVVELLGKLGATSYLSGPSAQSYLSEKAFREAGIKLEWMHYDNYPEYPQLYPPFAGAVSIIDLLFNVGASAPDFMLFSGPSRNQPVSSQPARKV